MVSNPIINLRTSLLTLTILVLSLVFVVTVALDIPVARQVIGFIYLTFIPGFIIVNLLELEELDLTETIMVSAGLSIAFLMIVGLMTNYIGPLAGIQRPLSTVCLVVVILCTVLALSILTHVRRRNLVLPDINIRKNLLGISFLGLPLLSVAGAWLVDISPSSNSLLILMIVAISILVVLTFSRKTISSKFYPLLLMTIAIGLLLHSSLVSSHINGFDVQHEYRFMKTTVAASEWTPNIYDKFQSLMSVSILPAIYWDVLDIDGIWISKIVYPLIFALVPLVLYKLYGIWTSERTAFLAAFFFMANSVFFTEMLTLGRQMIAEFFYVLLFFVLFNKKMGNMKRAVCFGFFSFGLVASHYAISYVFLFIILSTWLLVTYLSKSYKTTGTRVKISSVVLFSSVLFAWYIYVSSSATFNELLRVWDTVYRSVFSEFFNVESRGSDVLLGLGIGGPPSLLHLAGRIFAYSAELLILLGFIYAVYNRKKVFSDEYLMILSLNMALLTMAVILPNFASNLGMGRLYHIALLLLAPLFALGAETIAGFVSKSKKEILSSCIVLIVLVPFFLFQTGLVYEIAKEESWSISLSGYRFGWSQYSLQGLISDQDVYSVKWLTEYNNITSTVFQADGLTRNLLLTGGYGMIPFDRTVVIVSNTTEIEAGGIVYLRSANIVYNIIADGWNTAGYINSTLSQMNEIYSSGDCEIYKNFQQSDLGTD